MDIWIFSPGECVSVQQRSKNPRGRKSTDKCTHIVFSVLCAIMAIVFVVVQTRRFCVLSRNGINATQSTTPHNHCALLGNDTIQRHTKSISVPQSTSNLELCVSHTHTHTISTKALKRKTVTPHYPTPPNSARFGV